MKTKSTLRPNIKRLTLAAALALITQITLALPVVQMVRPLASYPVATNYTSQDQILLLQAAGANLNLKLLPAWNIRQSILKGQPFGGDVGGFTGQLFNASSQMTVADGSVSFPGIVGNYILAAWQFQGGDENDPHLPIQGGGAAVARSWPFTFRGPHDAEYFYELVFIGDDAVTFAIWWQPFPENSSMVNSGPGTPFILNDAVHPTGTYYSLLESDQGNLSASVTFTNLPWPSGFTSARMFTTSDDGTQTLYLHLANNGAATWNTTP